MALTVVEGCLLSSHGFFGIDLVAAELIHGFAQGASRLTELNHTRLEVAKRPLNEARSLLIVGKEIMPQGVLLIGKESDITHEKRTYEAVPC